jgi:hypothetical protein
MRVRKNENKYKEVNKNVDAKKGNKYWIKIKFII